MQTAHDKNKKNAKETPFCGHNNYLLPEITVTRRLANPVEHSKLRPSVIYTPFTDY